MPSWKMLHPRLFSGCSSTPKPHTLGAHQRYTKLSCNALQRSASRTELGSRQSTLDAHDRHRSWKYLDWLTWIKPGCSPRLPLEFLLCGLCECLWVSVIFLFTRVFLENKLLYDYVFSWLSPQSFFLMAHWKQGWKRGEKKINNMVSVCNCALQ